MLKYLPFFTLSQTSESYSLQNCIDALKAKDAASWRQTALRTCSLIFL
jgi:hypothetical protein